MTTDKNFGPQDTVSLIESCERLANKSASTRHTARMGSDELSIPYGCGRDVKANRQLFHSICETLIDNARKSNELGRRPTYESAHKLKSTPAPPKASEFHESTPGVELVDIRIFGVDSDGGNIGTYVKSVALRLQEGQDLVLVPYGIGLWNEANYTYIFDDGYSKWKYPASNEQEAREMWEAEVPVRQRSADTIVLAESNDTSANDVDGPYMIVTDRGTINLPSLAEVLVYVSDSDYRGSYRINDKSDKTIIKSTVIEQHKPESLTSKDISEVSSRGSFLLRLSPSDSSSLSFESATIECLGEANEGDILSVCDTDGIPLIATVKDAGKHFAIAEAIREDEAHVDDIRSARKVSGALAESTGSINERTFKSGKMTKQQKEKVDSLENEKVWTLMVVEGGIAILANYKSKKWINVDAHGKTATVDES